MTKQIGLSLGDVHVIDTSSLVNIKFEPEPNKVWSGIYTLIEQGKLKTVGYVFPELVRMVTQRKIEPGYLTALKEYRRQFVIPDEDIILEAGRINHLYPKLGDAFDPRNRADPWIVAAGKLKGMVVITEENDTGPGKTHRIPWACDQEGVIWTRLNKYITKEIGI